MAPTEFAPADVVLVSGGPPLTGTLGRSELEVAAAVMVFILQEGGRGWEPISNEELGAALRKAIRERKGTLWSWASNPVLKPDWEGLVDRGFVRAGGEDGLELTPEAIERLRPWVRRASANPTA